MNPEEWEAHLRVVFFYQMLLLFSLHILSLRATRLGCTLTDLAASVIVITLVTVVVVKGGQGIFSIFIDASYDILTLIMSVAFYYY